MGVSCQHPPQAWCQFVSLSSFWIKVFRQQRSTSRPLNNSPCLRLKLWKLYFKQTLSFPSPYWQFPSHWNFHIICNSILSKTLWDCIHYQCLCMCFSVGIHSKLRCPSEFSKAVPWNTIAFNHRFDPTSFVNHFRHVLSELLPYFHTVGIVYYGRAINPVRCS